MYHSQLCRLRLSRISRARFLAAQHDGRSTLKRPFIESDLDSLDDLYRDELPIRPHTSAARSNPLSGLPMSTSAVNKAQCTCDASPLDQDADHGLLCAVRQPRQTQNPTVNSSGASLPVASVASLHSPNASTDSSASAVSATTTSTFVDAADSNTAPTNVAPAPAQLPQTTQPPSQNHKIPD